MSRRVKLEKLSVSFGATEALREVSCEIAEGEFFVLLGPSGCGKTTLLRSLAGLQKPNSGRIVLGDQIVSDGAQEIEARDRKLGFVFQDLALWPHMTVRGHLEFVLGSGAAARSASVNDLLNRLHILPLADRRPDALSGGERQRLALARALVTEPDLLLMDEPMSSLDPQVAAEIRSLLAELSRERGITVVYVTHSQDEAFELADRIALMRDGRIVQVGAPEDLAERPCDSFAAGFVGAGALFPARVEAGVVKSGLGDFEDRTNSPSGAAVHVVVREGNCRIVETGAGSADAEVRRSVFRGDHYATEVDIDGHVLRAADDQRRERGSKVGLRLQGSPWVVAASEDQAERTGESETRP